MKTEPTREQQIDAARKLRRRGKKKEALKLLLALHSRWMNDAEILFLLGVTLDNLGRESDAIIRYHRALQLDRFHRRNYEIYLYLASSYHNLGQHSAARTNLRKAVHLGRRSPLQTRLMKILKFGRHD